MHTNTRASEEGGPRQAGRGGSCVSGETIPTVLGEQGYREAEEVGNEEEKRGEGRIKGVKDVCFS